MKFWHLNRRTGGDHSGRAGFRDAQDWDDAAFAIKLMKQKDGIVRGDEREARKKQRVKERVTLPGGNKLADWLKR